VTHGRISRAVWNASGNQETGLYRCHYCGVAVTKETGSLDHVVPYSKGGRKKRSNLVVACHPCNLHKADKEVSHWVSTSEWLKQRIEDVKSGYQVPTPRQGERLKPPRVRPASD
jgi:hypothetical protein